MTAIRTHRYTVADADFDELLLRRAALIGAIRGKHDGFVSARLARLDDGSYSDVWTWETPAQLGAALAGIPDIPEAFQAMALLVTNEARNGVVVDER